MPRASVARIALAVLGVALGCEPPIDPPSLPQVVTSVVVTPDSATLYPGDTLRLQATPFDAQGNAVAGRSVTWLGPGGIKDSIATLSASGLVTAVGTDLDAVTFTALVDSQTATATIRVWGSFASANAGGNFSCGVTTRATAYCWGRIPRRVPGGLAFTGVNAGTSYTCGVSTAGQGFCWRGSQETIGTGSLAPVELPGGFTWIAISTRDRHACGVVAGGAAYCWGANSYGQLGDGTTTASASAGAVTGGLAFSTISVGTYHTCGVTTAGAAYCWGDNGEGEFGTGTVTGGSTAPVPVPGGLTFSSITTGHRYTCGVTTSNAAYCWGLNDVGQLGIAAPSGTQVPPTRVGTLSFTSLVAGQRHACGVTTAGLGYCWGSGLRGNLGNGTTASSTSPVPVSGGLTFASIGPMSNSDFAHTCGVTTSGAAYCWGSNFYGQLATGLFDTKTVPSLVTGSRR